MTLQHARKHNLWDCKVCFIFFLDFSLPFKVILIFIMILWYFLFFVPWKLTEILLWLKIGHRAFYIKSTLRSSFWMGLKITNQFNLRGDSNKYKKFNCSSLEADIRTVFFFKSYMSCKLLRAPFLLLSSQLCLKIGTVVCALYIFHPI